MGPYCAKKIAPNTKRKSFVNLRFEISFIPNKGRSGLNQALQLSVYLLENAREISRHGMSAILLNQGA